jgi:hypothetical protein
VSTVVNARARRNCQSLKALRVACARFCCATTLSASAIACQSRKSQYHTVRAQEIGTVEILTRSTLRIKQVPKEKVPEIQALGRPAEKKQFVNPVLAHAHPNISVRSCIRKAPQITLPTSYMLYLRPRIRCDEGPSYHRVPRAVLPCRHPRGDELLCADDFVEQLCNVLQRRGRVCVHFILQNITRGLAFV